MDITLPNAIPNNSTMEYTKLFTALSKAQGEFPTIPKNSKVDVKNKEGKFLYSYKYADLTEIISATRPALTKYGLSFTQTYENGGFITELFHASGEVLKTGFVPCELGKNLDMKIVAGLFTYGKRISLTAALGVSADEDIDAAAEESKEGNSTTRSENKKKEAASETKDHAILASKAKVEELFETGKKNGWSQTEIKNYLKKNFGVENAYHVSDDILVKFCVYMDKFPLTKPSAAEEIPSPHTDSKKEMTSASQDQKQKNSDSTSQKSTTTEQTDSKSLSKELKDTIIETGSETWSYLNGSSFKEVPKEDLSRLHKWIVKEVAKVPAPKGVGSLVVLKRNIEKFLGGTK